MAGEILQGFQVGLNASLRIQELRSQEAARKARERAVAQEMALVMEQRNTQIQYRADMAKAIGSAQMLSSPTVPVFGPNGAIGRVENPNPLSTEDAAFQNILPVVAKYEPDKVPEVLRGIATAKYQQDQRQDFTPTAGTVQVQDGRTIPYVKTSPRSAQLVGESSIETITDPSTGRPISGVRTAAGGFKPLPQDIGARQQTAWALKNAPELMKLDDQGRAYLPPESFNEAARRSGLGQDFRTQMTEQIHAANKAFEMGRRILPLLTPENVGARGMFARKIQEAGMGQLFPEMKTGSASELLTFITNFRSSIVKAVKSDGNIAEAERESILEGIPAPEKFLSSVQDSKVKLAAQLEIAGITSRSAANAKGVAITPFWLKPHEIKQLVESGQRTEDEGIAMLEGSAWALINAIRADVQR